MKPELGATFHLGDHMNALKALQNLCDGSGDAEAALALAQSCTFAATHARQSPSRLSSPVPKM